MTTIKLSLDDDLRRFAWQHGPDFDALATLISDTYPQVLDSHQIKYVDDEGDLVTLTNNSEFEEALRSCAGGTILRLHLIKTKVKPQPLPRKNNERVVHHGVQCDGCGQFPLIGIRYKSTDTHDFDLCSGCFYKSSNPNFVEISAPKHQPATFGSFTPAVPLGAFAAALGARQSQASQPPCRPKWSCRGNSKNAGCKAGPCGSTASLQARFVQDVSIFDGTEMSAGTSFTKIWRLRNEGSQPWPVGTVLLKVGGDDLGSSNTRVVSCQPLRPGQELEVSMDMAAPDALGRYTSYFRLAVPTGFGEFKKFGQRLWCNIQVVDMTKQPTVQPTESVAQSSSTAQHAEASEATPSSSTQGPAQCVSEVLQLLSPGHPGYQLLEELLNRGSATLEAVAVVAACIQDDSQQVSLRDALTTLHARSVETHGAVMAVLDCGVAPGVPQWLRDGMGRVQQLLEEGPESSRFERYALELSVSSGPMLGLWQPMLQPALLQLFLPQLLASLQACDGDNALPSALHDWAAVLSPLFNGTDSHSQGSPTVSSAGSPKEKQRKGVATVSSSAATKHASLDNAVTPDGGGKYVYNSEVGAWMPEGMTAQQWLAGEESKRQEEEQAAANVPPPPPMAAMGAPPAGDATPTVKVVREEQELANMSVKQLRDLVQRAGLQHEDCVEKHELLALARHATQMAEATEPDQMQEQASEASSFEEVLAPDDHLELATLDDATDLAAEGQPKVPGEEPKAEQISGQESTVGTRDTPQPPLQPEQQSLTLRQETKQQLLSMGFEDSQLLEEVLLRNQGHGSDELGPIAGCLNDLNQLNEWEPLLQDLQEMGFEDQETNRVLLLRNAGNLKKVVHQLVKG